MLLNKAVPFGEVGGGCLDGTQSQSEGTFLGSQLSHLLETLRTGRSGSIASVVPHAAIWAGVSNAHRMWFHGISSPLLVQTRACPAEWGLGLWGATSFGARWAPSLGSSWGMARAAPRCESARLQEDGSVLCQDPSHRPPEHSVPVGTCLYFCSGVWGALMFSFFSPFS